LLRLSAIKVVGVYIARDSRGKQAGAWVAGSKAAAEIGGGHLFVDAGEEVDAGSLSRGEI
jgi:hypothetical protein